MNASGLEELLGLDNSLAAYVAAFGRAAEKVIEVGIGAKDLTVASFVRVVDVYQCSIEFERRHRVYGWGFIGDETLAVLRTSPQDTEQETVIRVLTERAVHAAEVIEDGSTSTLRDGEPRTYKTEDGRELQIPNLEADLRERVATKV